MSYDIHITRAEFWLDDEDPITLEEIERLVKPLPQGFSIDRTGIVTATGPQGQTLSAEVGPYLVYEDQEDMDSRICIYFDEESGPWFRACGEKYMLPVIELADMLHAKVQGDEDEIYTKEAVLKGG